MVDVDDLSEPAVRTLITAVNAGDRDGFFAALAPDATMSDDGTERNLSEWADRELFSADGRMEVESEADGGRSLVVAVTNSTWGRMRTFWRFEIDGGKITRFETGQA